MRVKVTERRDGRAPDLRPAGELAPSLALPWIVRLRNGVLAGEAILLLLTHFVFNVKLPLAWIAVPLAITAASNFMIGWRPTRLGARSVLGLVLTLDVLCLTALLAFTGGPANPFSLLYLVEIALSAVVLSKRWTWALGMLSIAGFGFLFPVHLRVQAFEAHHAVEVFSSHLVGMWIAFAASTLLVTVFIGKVSEALRRREQEVLQLRDQLSRHERLASVATLAAGAAHELGTPLATIAIASRELERYATRAPETRAIVEDARLIRAEVERCGHILRQMSANGAEPGGEAPRAVTIEELFRHVRNSFPAAESETIRCRCAFGLQAVLPEDATKQVLIALVRNALDASLPGSEVVLAAEREGSQLRMSVQDFGTGMRSETLNRMAEPFFSTKAPGRGMGLGTFLARLFAENLGGSLIFDSEPGVGTTAILELPLSEVPDRHLNAGVGSSHGTPRK